MYDFYLRTCDIKVKIKLSLYSFKAYRRMRAVASCILNLGSRRKWMVNITPQLPCPRASLDVLKKKKPLSPAGTRAPTCQAHTLITMPTSRIWRILLFYEIQQNSFNQTSRNLEILIIRHLRVIPSLEVLLFTSQKLCHWHWQISGTHSKRPPRLTNYINHCGIFWSLTRSASSALKTSKTRYITLMAMNQQMEISK